MGERVVQEISSVGQRVSHIGFSRQDKKFGFILIVMEVMKGFKG